MMTFVECLLELLGAAFGGTATQREVAKVDDEWSRLVWDLAPHSGDRLFRQPPAIEFREGGGDLRWGLCNLGMKHEWFSVSDLAAANPNDSTSRHPLIREIGAGVLVQLEDDNVESACHPAALMAALVSVHELRLDSAAAVCSEATGESYWRCYKYGELAWRYRLEGVGLALEPPYSPAQLHRAEVAVFAPVVVELIEKSQVKSGKKFLAILANEKAGIHALAAPPSP